MDVFLIKCGVLVVISDFFLFQIERVTGRRIVDLFDWIIGTSTGALIALCLTYGELWTYTYIGTYTESLTGWHWPWDKSTNPALLYHQRPNSSVVRVSY